MSGGEVAANLVRLRVRIDAALHSAGRAGDPITLVAVSKTFPAEAVEAALACGITDIGENRVQEAEEKRKLVRGPARWHLVGHLQRNKVRKALALFDLVQSVDSLDLASELSRQSRQPVEILVQVNCSGEAQKYGLRPEQTQEAVLQMGELERIRVLGLMTIGPWTDDVKAITRSFEFLRKLFEDLKRFESGRVAMRYLSMGMSGDFELAIRAGANMLRIGSLIFGQRGQV